MSTRIAFSINEIGRVYGGDQTLLIRLAMSSFTKIQPGARMWVAEPFHLERDYDAFSPTAARDRGARPAFSADFLQAPQKLAGAYGKRHPARSLCRDWHRANVIVRSRTELRLQDLTEADLANLGFRTASAFAKHWDAEAGLSGTLRYRWKDNPLVLKLGFELVNAPLKFTAKLQPKKRGPRPLTCKSTQPQPISPVASKPAIVAPAPRPVAPPSAPAPIMALPAHDARASRATSGPKTPIGEASAARKGDKAFLAALNAARPAEPRTGHAAAPPQTHAGPMIPFGGLKSPPSPTGTCPVCGTRIAFGCQHHPRIEESAA